MKRLALPAPPTNPPAATSSSSPKLNVPNEFCVRFHKYFTCNGDISCKKKHFCFLCRNPHRALLCPSLKATTTVTDQSFPVQPILRSYSPSPSPAYTIRKQAPQQVFPHRPSRPNYHRANQHSHRIGHPSQYKFVRGAAQSGTAPRHM